MSGYWTGLFMLGCLVVASCGSGDTDVATAGPAGLSATTDGAGGVDEVDLYFGDRPAAVRISGTVDFDGGDVRLRPPVVMPSGGTNSATPMGPFRLSLVDHHGDIVREIAFMPDDSNPPAIDEAWLAPFSLEIALPLPPLSRAFITYEGDEIGSVEVGSSVPTIEILTPLAGSEVSWRSDGIAWTADDAEGDELTFAILLSTTGGDGWMYLGSTFTDTEYAFSYLVDEPIRGEESIALVTATDGLNIVWARAGPFALT